MDLNSVTIKHQFTIQATNTLPSFTDTLYIDSEVWQTMTQEQLTSLEQERYQNWVAVVQAPPTQVAPSASEIQAEISTITQQMAQVAQDYAQAVGKLIQTDPTATIPPLPIPMAN